MKLVLYGLGALVAIGVVWALVQKLLFWAIGLLAIGAVAKFALPSLFKRG